MSQSLRDVLHAIVNELSVSSEVQRDRLHAAVDAATQEPVVAIHNVDPAVTTPVPPFSTAAPPVVLNIPDPTANNPYPDAQPG